MSEIIRPATAFALDAGGKRKRPRERQEGHLAFVRSLPCLICGGASEAAHVRYGDLRYGKRGTGKGEKPSDMYTVPLCRADHLEQHGSYEDIWWQMREIDPIRVALSLWSISGDEEAALEIIRRART